LAAKLQIPADSSLEKPLDAPKEMASGTWNVPLAKGIKARSRTLTLCVFDDTRYEESDFSSKNLFRVVFPPEYLLE